MTRYVTDTHALIWFLQSNSKLSANARKIFLAADAGTNQVLIPSIVLVELVYLAERKRIDDELVKRAFEVLTPAASNYAVAPLDIETVQVLQTVDRIKIPEMPDRIIAATAKHLRLPLITHDQLISDSGLVSAVW